MSKITFRADDDLVDQLEDRDISKSEAMREALREYLEGDAGPERDDAGAIDELVRDRVDERLDERLRKLGLADAGSRPRDRASEPTDVNVSVSLEGAAARTEAVRVGSEAERPRSSASDDREPNRTQDGTGQRTDAGDTQCTQCGEHLDGDHVHCPNCGEKASRRLFCDCGDEVRSDWSFCPGCGRRTPAADVLESNTGQF